MPHKKVAIIGAGAAGLVSAREALREGHEIQIFEKSEDVGGLWAYNPETEDDLTGQNPSKRVHSSLYPSLRTNIPRDLMAFSDYTFDSSGGGDDNWPRYPDHSCVLSYLRKFAQDFELYPHIQFNANVLSVKPDDSEENSGESPGWIVEANAKEILFDAVMVCNGHYTMPMVPRIPGTSTFGGEIIHSHNYRTPDKFKDKVVVVVGSASSGADISREVSTCAKAVYWCGDSFVNSEIEEISATHARLCSLPLRFEEGNQILLGDGQVIPDVDTVIFCTGYKYSFPFLGRKLFKVNENHVYPLYKEMINPSFPGLALIGIPYLVIPFPFFEIQARWFARLLSEKFELPEPEVMQTEMDSQVNRLKDSGIKPWHFHKLGETQTDYLDGLAKESGDPPLPDWFHELLVKSRTSRLKDPEYFREKDLGISGPTVLPSNQKQ